jgi:hypothetical protein
MGDQSIVADAAIAATLAHGHMPLEQAADMLWALGIGGTRDRALRMFGPAGALVQPAPWIPLASMDSAGLRQDSASRPAFT